MGVNDLFIPFTWVIIFNIDVFASSKITIDGFQLTLSFYLVLTCNTSFPSVGMHIGFQFLLFHVRWQCPFSLHRFPEDVRLIDWTYPSEETLVDPLWTSESSARWLSIILGFPFPHFSWSTANMGVMQCIYQCWELRATTRNVYDTWYQKDVLNLFSTPKPRFFDNTTSTVMIR